MEYNQDFVNRLREVMPVNFRKELHHELNKGKREKNRIPYSTVCDSLNKYRQGIRSRNGKKHSFAKRKNGTNTFVDKDVIYDKAVELLTEKGIAV